ncbi:MAG: Hydroxyacylglutathione hydrolase [Anaerolineales bacterium]|nr:Hydroxyacylglutathione hydrolase [Anaerolineales bacterium]
MNASFATFESAGGAKIFRLPLQVFPNFWAYAYVVQHAHETYLIDTGSGTDTSHEDLLRGLKQAHLSPSDLTHILLTHAHIDHYGGLSKLKPLTNAVIGCHELDAQTVAHHDASLALMSNRFASFLTSAGLAEEARDSLLGIYRFTKSLYQSVPVDLTYESQNMRVGPFEMIHVPGHCAGHVAMRLDDVVFCGDMVVEGVTPHLFPETIGAYNGLSHYLDSLEKLQAWADGARLVLNGHDEVITNLPEKIDTTHRNILRRMSRAVDALAASLTIAETCEAVYGKAEGYNLLLIVEKTGAYIEYLYEHGMIEIVNTDEVEQGLPAKYRRLREIADEEILLKHRKLVVE